MGADDWFTSYDWNADIEAVFWSKVRRSKTSKPMYLTYKAGKIVDKHPDVALEMLDEYFKLPTDSYCAEAWFHRGEAYQVLGRIPEAVEAFDAALAREKEYPSSVTMAYLYLPFLIAWKAVSDRYAHAVDVLDTNKKRILMPMDRFLWNAAQAIIAHKTGRISDSVEFAKAALEAAAAKTSGLRYHPNAELVPRSYEPVVAQLETLARRGD